MSINLDELRGGYDLRDYVAAAIGEPIRKSRDYHTFYCPFHNESGGSFQVWEDRYKCFGCGAYGDIINFVQNREGVTFLEAIESLQGHTGPITRPVQRRTIEPKPILDFKPDALRAAQNVEIALPYMEQRGIVATVATDHLTGAVINYEHKYFFSQQESVSFRCLRYSLPNFLNGKCRGINYRRDDNTVLEAFRKLDQKLIAEVRAREAKRESETGRDPRVLRFDDLIDIMFGRKYLRQTGSFMGLYNGDLLLKNGVPLPWSYMLCNEGKEIDVLSLVSQGFPAVGIPQNNKLEPAKGFERVAMKYIIADNDEAGRIKATWIQQKLGGGTILIPPAPFKDANDMVVAGELKPWLAKYGIEPVLH